MLIYDSLYHAATIYCDIMIHIIYKEKKNATAKKNQKNATVKKEEEKRRRKNAKHIY